MREDWCKGCLLCLKVCPRSVFTQSESIAKKGFKLVVPKNEKNCIGCLLCEHLCPDLVITINKDVG